MRIPGIVWPAVIALIAIIAVACSSDGDDGTATLVEAPIPLGITLQGVSSEELEALGMTFKELDPSYVPQITQAEVEEMAKDQGIGKGAAIQETILTRLVTTNMSPPVDGPTWVISFRPKDVHAPFVVGGTTKFAITIYDAESGDLVFSHISSIGGNRPLPQLPLPTPK